MDEIYQTYHDVKITDKGLVWNTDLIEALELENLLGNCYFIFSPSIADSVLSSQQEGVERRTCQRRLPWERWRQLHDAHELHNQGPQIRKGRTGIQASQNVHSGRIRIRNSTTSKESLLILNSI